jgi:hypothetical protein
MEDTSRSQNIQLPEHPNAGALLSISEMQKKNAMRD